MTIGRITTRKSRPQMTKQRYVCAKINKCPIVVNAEEDTHEEAVGYEASGDDQQKTTKESDGCLLVCDEEHILDRVEIAE